MAVIAAGTLYVVVAGLAVLGFLLGLDEPPMPDTRAVRSEGRELLSQLYALGGADLDELVRRAGDLPPEFWESEAWPGKTWVFGWEDDYSFSHPNPPGLERTVLSGRHHPGPWLCIGEYCFGDFDPFELWCDVSTGGWLSNS